MRCDMGDSVVCGSSVIAASCAPYTYTPPGLPPAGIGVLLTPVLSAAAAAPAGGDAAPALAAAVTAGAAAVAAAAVAATEALVAGALLPPWVLFALLHATETVAAPAAASALR